MTHILAHMHWLTDDFGIWQHTKGDQIHREMGYALDDAARGLIVFLRYNDEARAKVCLDYLEHSQTAHGFVGFYDGDRKPLDSGSSDDAHALAIWALAEAIAADFHTEQTRKILAATDTNALITKGYTRTLAYLLLAYAALGQQAPAKRLVTQLVNRFDATTGWFEPMLTYANAALPLALLKYVRAFNIQEPKLLSIIEQSIATLEDYCRLGVIPAPVGNRIWQKLGAVERDIYGQQPIDPGFTVLMLVEAFHVFKDQVYLAKATDWIRWFYGNNIYQTSLISPLNACGDGLYALPRGVCHNKGAESTIMYLLALHAFKAAGGKARKVTQ